MVNLMQEPYKSTTTRVNGDSTRVYNEIKESSHLIEGLKESDGKVVYDLSWEFIEAMAKRMGANTGKYPKDNWKLPINIDSLKQALMRHTIEVLKGNYVDEGVEFQHVVAIAVNAMMINYQLTNNNK